MEKTWKERLARLITGGNGRRIGATRRNVPSIRTFHQAIKWAAPCFFCGFGFYLQSVFLHYATYSYVHKMLGFSPAERVNPHYATLSDPVEKYLGYEQIDLGILDAFAAFFPFLFLVMTLLRHTQTLQVWTKVLICGFFLFTLKGLIGAMTTIPDSSGWKICEGRLKPEGMAWMSTTHAFSEFFTLDYHWVTQYHHSLRYCSDMMYSGHTFCVTLFALGCYEQLRIVMEGKRTRRQVSCLLGHPDKDTATLTQEQGNKLYNRYTALKIIAFALLSILSVGEQCVEIYFVLKSHFHYTSDIVIAMLLTFLFYTNSAIAIFAKQWEVRGIHLLWGAYPDAGTTEQATSSHEHDSEDMWVSKGDVYVPWCCFPFCCMSGRAHVYSDSGIYEIVDKVSKGAQDKGKDSTRPGETDELTFLMKDMNLFEGVCQVDLFSLCGLEQTNPALYEMKKQIFFKDLTDPNSRKAKPAEAGMYNKLPADDVEALSGNVDVLRKQVLALTAERDKAQSELDYTQTMLDGTMNKMLKSTKAMDATLVHIEGAMPHEPSFIDDRHEVGTEKMILPPSALSGNRKL